LNIRVEECFVLELHDSAKRIAFSSRRNIWAHMGLEKSGDNSLKGGYVFCSSVLLRFRCPLLPLKCEDVKDACRLVFRTGRFRRMDREKGGGGSYCGRAVTQYGASRRFRHLEFSFSQTEGLSVARTLLPSGSLLRKRDRRDRHRIRRFARPVQTSLGDFFAFL